jgi:PE family
MSFVSVVQDGVSEAARTLAGIRSELSAAGTAAAVPTTGVAAAAQDEVSIAIAGVFGDFGQEFQALSAQAQAFHEQFVSALTAGLGQYLSAEATNVQQTLLNAVNAPALGLAIPGVAGSGSIPVLNYPTPLGPITLTLYGNQLLTTVDVTGGSLQVPTPLALAVDALGPEANVLFALRDSSAAFASAVQTGNPLAAAQTLIKAPVNAVTGFFVGQQSITGSDALPSESGYKSFYYSIPVDGLLAPLQPVTFGLIAEDGVANQFPLMGTEFGGLLPAIGGLLTGL